MSNCGKSLAMRGVRSVPCIFNKLRLEFVMAWMKPSLHATASANDLPNGTTSKFATLQAPATIRICYQFHLEGR